MPIKSTKNSPVRAKGPTDEEPVKENEEDTEIEAQERGAEEPEEPQSKNGEVHADRQSLLIGLNHDLSGEYQSILMYTHYAAKMTGPYRKELRALFQAEIADEQGHAQFLADKIAALGGEPTTQPRPVMSADNPRAMLENALTAEKQAIADYQVRIEQAEAFGDVGLKVDLENQIADETRHKEEMERILAGWKT